LGSAALACSVCFGFAAIISSIIVSNSPTAVFGAQATTPQESPLKTVQWNPDLQQQSAVLFGE